MSKPGQNKEFVYAFNALSPAQQSFAGGKGGALARLYQAGYPVPDGFVILPTAFDNDMLKPEAWTQVQTHLERLRSRDRQIAFAVRSSAMSEDAARASFAGEFETVLDEHTDDGIREAIHTVRRSRHAERVRAYSEAKGLDTAHDMAVVVQQLIRAKMSGVLFTADPVTGSRTRMMGNFVHGLGDQLVSGEATGEMFSLGRREGLRLRVDYQGPPPLEPFSRQLYTLGSRLEKELGCPQDTEWCIADGRLYLLQSRPITTLREYDPITYDWNSSFTGDYLWVTQEVHPEVMTPSTWSFWQKIMGTMKIAGVPGIGNIGGRLYVNYSVMYSTSLKFKRRVEELDVFVGHPPANVDIPIISIQTLRLFLDMIPVMAKTLPKVIRLRKVWKQVLDKAPERCRNLSQQIQGAQQQVLVALWHEQVFPLFEELLYLQDTINDEYMMPYASLKAELIDLVGEDEAQTMLSTLSSGSGQLASIGPLVGLDRMRRGEMSREQYTELYGHRHANENELSVPRPCETSNWLDKRLAEFEQDPVDVPEMQRRRVAESDALWAELEARYSEKATALKQKADQVLQVMHRREAVRSELTRSVGVARAFFLRAGQLTGLGDDVFFLTCQELLGMLSGEDTPAAATIPARRESYEKYKALPDYPAWVRGRFDPVQWATDPYRRHDYFDSHASVQSMEEASDTIQGVAGSAGRVEGMVRLLSGPQAGDQLRKGEILVAATTNVGWTPLFSRAAGVITDIGAPLSHAAIVARELGIPAVVGCGNATMQLKTGDRVLMDGGRGTVRILRQER